VPIAYYDINFLLNKLMSKNHKRQQGIYLYVLQLSLFKNTKKLEGVSG